MTSGSSSMSWLTRTNIFCWFAYVCCCCCYFLCDMFNIYLRIQTGNFYSYLQGCKSHTIACIQAFFKYKIAALLFIISPCQRLLAQIHAFLCLSGCLLQSCILVNKSVYRRISHHLSTFLLRSWVEFKYFWYKYWV